MQVNNTYRVLYRGKSQWFRLEHYHDFGNIRIFMFARDFVKQIGPLVFGPELVVVRDMEKRVTLHFEPCFCISDLFDTYFKYFRQYESKKKRAARR